jgi:hypothetical protein
VVVYTWHYVVMTCSVLQAHLYDSNSELNTQHFRQLCHKGVSTTVLVACVLSYVLLYVALHAARDNKHACKLC